MQDCNWLGSDQIFLSFVFSFFRSLTLSTHSLHWLSFSLLLTHNPLCLPPCPWHSVRLPQTSAQGHFVEPQWLHKDFFFFHNASVLWSPPLPPHTISCTQLSAHTVWCLIFYCVNASAYVFFLVCIKALQSTPLYPFEFSEWELLVRVSLIASSPLRSIWSISPLMFECLSFEQEV